VQWRSFSVNVHSVTAQKNDDVMNVCCDNYNKYFMNF
jgi:hypothetical protein